MTSCRMPTVGSAEDWKAYLDDATVIHFKNLHEADYNQHAMHYNGICYRWKDVKTVSENVLAIFPSTDVLTSMERYFSSLRNENQKVVKQLDSAIRFYKEKPMAISTNEEVDAATEKNPSLIVRIADAVQRFVKAIFKAVAYFFGYCVYHGSRNRVKVKAYLLPNYQEKLKIASKLNQEIEQAYNELRVLLDIKEEELLKNLESFGQLTSDEREDIVGLLKDDPYFSKRHKLQKQATEICLMELDEPSITSLHERLYPETDKFDLRLHLKRRMRQEFGTKLPLELPSRDQISHAKFNWEMPIPPQFMIEPVTEHVPLSQLLKLLDEIKHLLPDSIPDDRDDRGYVIRYLSKASFLAMIRSKVSDLEKKGTITDSFSGFPLPQDITEKVIAILQHFVLWDQKTRAELLSNGEEEQSLVDHKKELARIFIEYIGIPFFHCSDRIALSLEHLYFIHIAQVVFGKGDIREQIRGWMVNKRIEVFEEILNKRLSPANDFTTNLRYYRGKYGDLLGIAHCGVQDEIPDRYEGTVDHEIGGAIKRDIEDYKKNQTPEKLIRELTKKINKSGKDPLFNSTLLVDLFQQQYLKPEGLGFVDILADDDGLWSEEATAQLLFDANVISFVEPRHNTRRRNPILNVLRRAFQ